MAVAVAVGVRQKKVSHSQEGSTALLQEYRAYSLLPCGFCHEAVPFVWLAHGLKLQAGSSRRFSWYFALKFIWHFAQSLVVLRGLMGVGLGGAPVAFALFLELVPSSKRGVLMVALQSFWTVGSMLEVQPFLSSFPFHFLCYLA